MRFFFASLLIFTVYSCSSHALENQSENAVRQCLGNSELPDDVSNLFEPVDDAQLLNEALGEKNRGKLCQGQVYKVKEGSHITIYRAWNSTNPNSEFGNWWAFDKPTGKISAYRHHYEICFQWTPLDKLESCTLKPGSKVVVGTGQSVKCSDFETLAISDKKQIFIHEASASLTNCSNFDAEFSWKPLRINE